MAADRPWYDGGLSATAVDLAYWREMFPYENRYERPTLHVSIQANGLLYKWQPPPDAPAADASAAGGARGPPVGSPEHTFLRMLSAVTQARRNSRFSRQLADGTFLQPSFLRPQRATQ